MTVKIKFPPFATLLFDTELLSLISFEADASKYSAMPNSHFEIWNLAKRTEILLQPLLA